ncbi:MAG: Mrp/NBP35 family ATP-binding protein [Candidatus Methanofastidiosa archaeon]|nr:Mrp/NBP35 family ATP-binding protein [Candidatus Methanofastidiosa archaeon]
MVQQNQKIEERMSKIKRKIAIASGKGGVGKSLVSGLIATYLAKKGNKVGILDADITGPSIPKMFGVDGLPGQGQDGIIPPVSEWGIKIMSLSLVLHDNSSAVIWRGPMVANAIRQFMSDIDWGELDYLIVDLPPGTSDAPLTVMQSMKLDGMVVVTSPQQLAFEIVRKAISMSKTMNVKVLGLVQNMAYALCPKCGEKFELFGKDDGETLAELAEVPYLGSIPLDPFISKYADSGDIESYDGAFVDGIMENLLKNIQ